MGALAAAVFGLSGLFWYCFFYRREKKLLDRLQNMLRQAEKGKLLRETVSEEKVSALEDGMKKFLDNCLLENESHKSQKQVIQRLISDIAHQTLTPVSNLKLYTGLLEERAEREPEILDFADTIREQTEKLEFLIRSLVRLSRMEAGMISVHPRKEKVSCLLLSVCREYEERAAQKGVSLLAKETFAEAVYDGKWMREALGNIVDNAIKYTKSGGTVCIRVRPLSFFVRIDVEDTGIGIAQEEVNRIFSRFYRGSATQDQPGVGIGLYLAREIVQAQKGYITLSSSPQKGSVFSVFLPAG